MSYCWKLSDVNSPDFEGDNYTTCEEVCNGGTPNSDGSLSCEPYFQEHFSIWYNSDSNIEPDEIIQQQQDYSTLWNTMTGQYRPKPEKKHLRYLEALYHERNIDATYDGMNYEENVCGSHGNYKSLKYELENDDRKGTYGAPNIGTNEVGLTYAANDPYFTKFKHFQVNGNEIRTLENGETKCFTTPEKN